MSALKCPECHHPVTRQTTRCPNCDIKLGQDHRRPVRAISPRARAVQVGWSDLLRMALQGLLANKVRAMFPVIGVVFGIGTVILLMAIGHGVKLDITRQFAELGPQVITVRSGNRGEEVVDGKKRKELPFPIPPRQLMTSSLELNDVEEIRTRDSAGLIQAGTGATNVTNPVKQEIYAGNDLSGDPLKAPLIGTDDHYLEVRGLQVIEGRFIRNVAEDEDKCAVGKSILNTLFEGITPAEAVESTHQLTLTDPELPDERKLTCTIVGVMEPRGQTIVGDLDRQIYVPLRAFNQRLYQNPAGKVNELEFLISDPDQVDEAYARIEEWMSDIKEGDPGASFTVLSHDDLLARFNQILTILTALVIGVSAVSLLESVVGVLTIMYVSVKERTQEIGVRKATGATEEQIVRQFLLEAVVLSLVGGLIGTPTGVLAAIVVDRFTTLPTHVTASSVMLAFVLILTIGVVAGAYPARRAAKVPPRVALGVG